MNPTANVHLTFCKSWKSVTQTLSVIRDGECAFDFVQVLEKCDTEAFSEESMSHTWVFEWHVQTH
jgi:hypothetical protein